MALSDVDLCSTVEVSDTRPIPCILKPVKKYFVEIETTFYLCVPMAIKKHTKIKKHP